MKILTAILAGGALLGPLMMSPQTASAQSAAAYGSGDICKGQKVKCVSYPQSVTVRRAGCQWVEETYGGKAHGFEVCKDKDGVWRPSGRA